MKSGERFQEIMREIQNLANEAMQIVASNLGQDEAESFRLYGYGKIMTGAGSEDYITDPGCMDHYLDLLMDNDSADASAEDDYDQ